VQELLARLQEIDPAYKPWMISVTYEIERKAKRPADK
jgi:hypothetical protein